MSSRVDRGRFWSESTLADVKPCRVESARNNVETSQPGSMSGRVGPDHFRVELTWADVESSDSSRCLAELAWTDVWPSQLRPISSRVDLGRCQSEPAQTYVEPSQPRLISSRVSPGWTDVKLSWPGPNRCQVESI